MLLETELTKLFQEDIRDTSTAKAIAYESFKAFTGQENALPAEKRKNSYRSDEGNATGTNLIRARRTN